MNNPTSIPLRSLLTSSLLFLATASVGFAEIVASESFDYGTGGNLNGASGGSGWASGWTAVTGSTAGVTLETNEGSTAAYFSGTDPNANNFAYRQLSTGFTGDVLYVSYMLEVEQVPSSDFFALWLDDNNNNISHSGDTLNMGLGTSNNLFSRVNTNRASENVNGSTATAGTYYQLVVEYSKSTPGVSEDFNTIKFWINPSNADYANPIGSAGLFDSTGLTSIEYLGFRGAANESGDAYWVDDIVLGTTWNDVTAVPEPASTALFAGMLVLALLLRRRCSK